MFRSIRPVIVMVLTLVVTGIATNAAAQNQYRRWLDDGKTFTCSAVPGPAVEILLSNQDIEFNNLPADAQWIARYYDRGIQVHVGGPFTVEQTSGTHNYASFLETIPGGFPARFDFRMETLINCHVVYLSTLTADCTGTTTAPLPVTITNLDTAGIGIPSASSTGLGLLAFAVVVLGYVLLRRAVA